MLPITIFALAASAFSSPIDSQYATSRQPLQQVNPQTQFQSPVMDKSYQPFDQTRQNIGENRPLGSESSCLSQGAACQQAVYQHRKQYGSASDILTQKNRPSQIQPDIEMTQQPQVLGDKSIEQQRLQKRNWYGGYYGGWPGVSTWSAGWPGAWGGYSGWGGYGLGGWGGYGGLGGWGGGPSYVAANPGAIHAVGPWGSYAANPGAVQITRNY